MKSDRFNELVNELRSASLDTLVAKNAGYSSDEDKLHNFHVGADIMGGTPAQAAWGYATKHLVALRDKIQRNDFTDRADFLEKCQDAINYICLIWCIGNEEMEKYNQIEKSESSSPRDRTNITYKNMLKHNRPYEDMVDIVQASCPGDYFKGAPRHDDEPPCDYVSSRGSGHDDCLFCWDQAYKGEEMTSDGREK